MDSTHLERIALLGSIAALAYFVARSKKRVTAKWILPDKQVMVASQWGARRDGGNRTHKGIDYSAPEGTLIVAPWDGRIGVGFNDKGGLGITITRADGWQIYVAHLKDTRVSTGDTVKMGQPIGIVGRSGNAAHLSPQNAHVHLQLKTPDGQIVDPQKNLEWRTS